MRSLRLLCDLSQSVPHWFRRSSASCSRAKYTFSIRPLVARCRNLYISPCERLRNSLGLKYNLTQVSFCSLNRTFRSLACLVNFFEMNRDWCLRRSLWINEVLDCSGHIWPVLKHGPRSLTCARAFGWKTPKRNESDSVSQTSEPKPRQRFWVWVYPLGPERWWTMPE